jgi:hypothetical protein
MVTEYEPRRPQREPRTKLVLSKGLDQLDLRDLISNYFIFSTSGASGLGFTGDKTTTKQTVNDNILLSSVLEASTIQLPLYIEGQNKNQIQDILDRLSRILNINTGLARLDYGQLYNPTRYKHVYQASIADIEWGQETNARTWALTELKLSTKENYWTYSVKETLWSSGLGIDDNIIEPFSTLNLRIGSSAIGGELHIENYGTLYCPLLISVQSPVSEVEVKNEEGNHFKWIGDLDENDELIINSKDETVTNLEGSNLFSGVQLGSKFIWIKPGHQQLHFRATSPYHIPRAQIEYQARYKGAF